MNESSDTTNTIREAQNGKSSFEKSSDESSHFCNMRKILNHHIDDMKPLSDPIFNRTFEYRDSRIDYVIIKDYNFHSLALK